MRITQKQRILHYLHINGSITNLEARDNLAILCLPARILELKKAGYNITSKRERGKNRFGETTHYVRYILNESR